MKVVYNDPDGRPGTFHPKLGYLKSGETFGLSDGEAEKYISVGFLAAVEEPSKPGTKNMKRETTTEKAQVESGMTASSDESEIQQGEEV